jgi:hypothetical protein
MNNFKERANFIWSIADLLRGDYRQSEYGRVSDAPILSEGRHSFTTLNKIEIGDIRHSRIDTVGKIAGALKVEIDKLVNG